MPHRRFVIAGLRGLIIAISGLCISQAVWAVTLDYRLEAAASVTFSNNIELAPEGFEETGVIGELTPAFGLSAQGQRLTASLEYRLRYLNYWYTPTEFYDDNQQPITDDRRYEPEAMHRLLFTSNTELLRDRLFLDANAGRDQVLVDPFARGASPDRVLNTSGNLTDQRTLTLSPYLVQSFGGGAAMMLRYGYDEVDYDDIEPLPGQAETRLLNSETRRIEATFDTSASGNPLSLEILYNRDEVRFGDVREVGLEEGSITLGYMVLPSLNVFGTWGDENYTVFQSAIVNESQIVQNAIDTVFGEPFREFGLRWAPGNSTNVEIARGKRFFGRTGRFEFNHNRLNRVLTVRYQEDVAVDPRRQLLSQSVVRVDAGTGQLVEQNRWELDDFDIHSITPFLFIEKVATVAFVHQLTRSAITVESVWGERIYPELDNSYEKVSGWGYSYEYRIGRSARLGVSTDIRWLEEREVLCDVTSQSACQRFQESAQEGAGDRFIRHAISFNWQYARQQRLTVTQRYLERSPGSVADGGSNADNRRNPGYREHAWIIAVNIEF